MYVETKGPTLEELAKLIDGDDAKVASVGKDSMEKEDQGSHHREEIGKD